MREEFGALVPASGSPASGLREALARLLADDAGRKRMGEAARTFARQERFSDRAAELARLLMERWNGFSLQLDFSPRSEVSPALGRRLKPLLP